MLLNHFVELLLNYCDNRPCSPRSVGFLWALHVLNNGRIQLTPLQLTITRRFDFEFLVRFSCQLKRNWSSSVSARNRSLLLFKWICLTSNLFSNLSYINYKGGFVFKVYRVHLLNLLHYQFPDHYGFILKALLKGKSVDCFVTGT